jgi:hypothetical protein
LSFFRGNSVFLRLLARPNSEKQRTRRRHNWVAGAARAKFLATLPLS